jgi:hypothetical protein
MARELRVWIGATIVACVALALLYLPPRGVMPEERPRSRALAVTIARLEAQRLVAAWRAADQRVRLAEYRRRLEPELAIRRAGPAVLFTGTDTLPPSARRSLESALDTVWGRLGLGVTKVSVGVILEVPSTRPPPSGDRPKGADAGPVFLLPDSIDRATCVVLVPVGYWIRRALDQEPAVRDSMLVESLRGGLGPCAFYAAYGTPGASVKRWLIAREHDVALDPAWYERRPAPPLGWPLVHPTFKRWDWDAIYSQPAAAVACLAGRAARCREAVLQGADAYGADPVLRPVAPRPWWWRRERLVQGYRFLADVAGEVGHDRFSRFWSSTLPVDTALATALNAPVGEWTERWQRRFAPRLPLGADVPPGAAVLGMLLAAVAVATVALGVLRREVR